jgi:hypothetical protein
MCTFPQELFDRVIDISRHDRTTLLKYSFVSRSWALSTQRWLFRKVVVNSPAAWARLLVILKNKSNIGSHVRSLEVKCFIPIHDICVPGVEGLIPGLTKLTLNAPIAQLDLFTCFPRIQHLVVHPVRGIQKPAVRRKAVQSLLSLHVSGSDRMVSNFLDWLDTMGTEQEGKLIKAAVSYGFSDRAWKKVHIAQARLIRFTETHRSLQTLKLLLSSGKTLHNIGKRVRFHILYI